MKIINKSYIKNKKQKINLFNCNKFLKILYYLFIFKNEKI